MKLTTSNFKNAATALNALDLQQKSATSTFQKNLTGDMNRKAKKANLSNQKPESG